MKKLLSALAAVAFAAFCADTGFAAVTGTAHDTAIGAQGSCSACHIPHKSVGKRLWPSNMSGQEADFGEVGALCFYCHGPAGGAGLANAVNQNIMTLTSPGGMYSHGLAVTDIPAGGNGMAASGLSYANKATVIECTTCHNVHDDTNRPFLARDIDVLCAQCHTIRMYVGGVAQTNPAAMGAWGGAFYGTTNPGTHPVGTDVTGDNSGGASPITITGVMQVAKSAAVGGWALGGHLSGAGVAVTCTTCHAPHGVQPDVDPQPAPTAAGSPHLGLLAISQDTADSRGDGDGAARNALCEGCHVNSVATWDAAANAAYGGTNEPNPGGTAYTHPVDDLGSKYTTVPDGANFPVGGGSWPVGSTAGTNMNPAVICESCHTPHPNANAALTIRGSADYVIAASGTPILRDTASTICGGCHTQTIAGHHPIGTYLTARFNVPADGSPNGIGDNASPLTCGDCHNGAGAHNWVGASAVGLDPDWVPVNNGRTATDTKAGEVNDNASTTCTVCHTGQNTHYSPTSASADDGAAPVLAPLSGRTRGSYQDDGDGSHYLGDTAPATLNYANGFLAGAAFNATTATTWGGAPNGAGWSRFDTTGTNHVVCESCHDVEPDKNSGATKPMLLGNYIEGAAIDPSDLCEACHSQTPGGAQPHPMTGDSISRAVLAGVAPTTLVTTGRYTKALTALPGTGWSGGSTAPALTNALNCDSCHQPHDASTNGGTYIYESNLVTGTIGAGPGNGHPPRGSSVPDIQDLPFCNNCHTY